MLNQKRQCNNGKNIHNTQNVSKNKRALTARLRKPEQYLSRLQSFAGKQWSASLHSSGFRQPACLHQTTELQKQGTSQTKQTTVDSLASTVMFRPCTTGLMEGLKLLPASCGGLQSQLTCYKTIQTEIATSLNNR